MIANNKLIEKRIFMNYAPNQDRIIYNRIPKCGSTTVMKVLQTLAEQNAFNYVHSKEFNKVVISSKVQRAMINSLLSLQTPWLYDRHLQMLNFTAEGLPMPDYINVFREPLERSASYYYYTSKDKRWKLSFDECVKIRGFKCTGPINILAYLCSRSQHCFPLNENSLQIIKQNVERYYTVVGIAEDLESFFDLLEYRYPKTFRGALNVYRNITPQNVDKRKSSHPIEESTRDALKYDLRYEYMFYEFIKQRLYNAKLSAGII